MSNSVEDTKVDTPNYLEMSDEEMLKQPPPEPVAVEDKPVDKEPAEDKAEDSEEAGDDDEATEAAGAAKAAAEAEEEEPDDEQPDAKAEDKSKVEDKTPAKEEKPKEKEAEASKEEAKTDKEETKSVDYEAEYKKILTPFKANGRDIQVNSVDDAITLMKMGANYSKKMAALKPNLKIMQMLEKNNLLDETKLSFFIDLDKKNPEAINKLIKDSGIDPLTIDPEKGSGYKGSTHAVSDNEFELENVLAELKDSPKYNQVLDVVGNTWDAQSKQTIAKAPQLLKLLDSHMNNGVYEIVSNEIERKRLLGHLSGVSDFDAYRQVGDEINARGGFNHLGSSQKETTPEKVVIKPEPKKQEDDKLKDKKRAASSSKPAVPSSKKSEFNPLAVSDEEFSKLAKPTYV